MCNCTNAICQSFEILSLFEAKLILNEELPHHLNAWLYQGPLGLLSTLCQVAVSLKQLYVCIGVCYSDLAASICFTYRVKINEDWKEQSVHLIHPFTPTACFLTVSPVLFSVSAKTELPQTLVRGYVILRKILMIGKKTFLHKNCATWC